MPSRNIIRYDVDRCYYHVYVRGINRDPVFIDDEDKAYMVGLFERHLSLKPAVGVSGYPYKHYRGVVELLAYCIMDNHLHVMLYQIEKGGVAELMRSIIVAYTAYFNRKHNRTGKVFESRYKSSAILNDTYLLHISRYIHLNPRSWKRYRFSSFNAFHKAREPEWLQSEKVLGLFDNNRKKYAVFVADYEDHKKMLAEIKYELANL